MKQQMNVRVPPRTKQQLDALAEQMSLTRPEVVMLAVERLFLYEYDLTEEQHDEDKRITERLAASHMHDTSEHVDLYAVADSYSLTDVASD